MIRIKLYEFEGNKYISVHTIKDDKWFEKSFEYIDNDKLSVILSMVETNINSIYAK